MSKAKPESRKPAFRHSCRTRTPQVCPLHVSGFPTRCTPAHVALVTGYSESALAQKRKSFDKGDKDHGSPPFSRRENGKPLYDEPGWAWLDAKPKHQSTSDPGRTDYPRDYAAKPVFMCSPTAKLPCGCTVDALAAREYVTPKFAALITGYSVRTLEAMRSDGNGPRFIKLSDRAVRYQVCDLWGWLADHLRQHPQHDFVGTAVQRRSESVLDSWLTSPIVPGQYCAAT